MARYGNPDGLDTKWDPLADDYNDDQFNSYDRGPGRDLPKKSARSKEVSLYITGIPLEMTEDGLVNLFSKAGVCINAKKMKSKRDDGVTTYGFVKMGCLKDGAEAIRLYNGFKIGGHFQLNVQFSKAEEEKSREQAQQMEEDEFIKSLQNRRKGGSKHSSDSDSENRRDYLFSSSGEKIMFGKSKAPTKMMNGATIDSPPRLQNAGSSGDIAIKYSGTCLERPPILRDYILKITW